MIIQIGSSMRPLEDLVGVIETAPTEGNIQKPDHSCPVFENIANNLDPLGDLPAYAYIDPKIDSNLVVIEKVFLNFQNRRKWAPSTESGMIKVIDQVAHDLRSIETLCQRKLEVSQGLSARILRFHLDHEWRVMPGSIQGFQTRANSTDPDSFFAEKAGILSYMKDEKVISVSSKSPTQTRANSWIYPLAGGISGGVMGWGIASGIAVYKSGFGNYLLGYGVIPAAFAWNGTTEVNGKFSLANSLAATSITAALWSGLIGSGFQGMDLVLNGFYEAYALTGTLLGIGVGSAIGWLSNYLENRNVKKNPSGNSQQNSTSRSEIYQQRNSVYFINYALSPRYDPSGRKFYFPNDFWRGDSK